MRRRRFRPLAGLLPALLASAPLAGQVPSAPFDSAYVAWDAGDYVVALERLERLLAGPSAAAHLADAAVLTGERYRTVEVAPDGTAPRWSPDGRYAAFDLRGDVAGTVVVAVEADGTVRPVAEVRGYGVLFSPADARIAYLRTADADALAREERQIRSRIPVRSRADLERLRRELDASRARHARVVIHDLASGSERELASPGLRVYEIAWSGDGAFVWALAATEADGDAAQVYALGQEEGPRRETDSPLPRRGLRVSPTGTHLAVQDPQGVSLMVLANGGLAHYRGASGPVFSADGSALAFVASDGDEHTLRRVRLGDRATVDAETLIRTTDRLSSPALSADGSMAAVQRTGRENQEVWTAGAGEPYQLTQDVQHDLFPAFLSGDRVLVIKGEGRHRRSYVYPVRPDGEPAIREWVPGLGEGMRLFHNNTVRTVAPEYEWSVSPDGTKVLIVSERDGDTISPERGVYLTDLGRPVDLVQVRARVRAQLAAERDLRERGRLTFQPVADAVRAAVEDVSVSRIYRYESDLFRFGSKFITQPGNAQAVDYLTARLREFGYEPELQWFEPRPGLRSANVIARLRGTAHPDIVYVVSSHFDSVERGPGADDNTSGTTALLEAARVMATRPQPATIEFAFFTGEEAGLLGSREFARRAIAEGKTVVGALNNDMVGYANDQRLDNTIRYSNAGIRDLQHAAAFLFTDLILHDAHYYKSTDAHALFDAFGDVIGGIGSYPILANPHYHREHDVLETINHRLVAEVSKATAASILRMAAGPSRIADVRASPGAQGVEVTWTAGVESDVSEYVVVYGPTREEATRTLRVDAARAALPDARPGWAVGVKAVSRAGIESWDWGWTTVGGDR